ncbi:ketopantoate reductase family protein [Pedobacter punctiformis]|uniref:2-dehydropantoate 2-reductase n=1 Tax=Pedobacter punctiformis TaxID=3004097 RepID=A0ABT4LB14_9SPHI|nr:2-dehydropantoate 2-reductase [Pedobacter sp. HCMS5-2]MCZ4245115.1 2-dehydropantoate 2-reductase [Pedobacter sp. HCMS5-2]
MKTKELAVIGLGGVGGYFGFKLAQKYFNNGQVNISFVARTETFETVKQNGLTLLSAEHENAVAKPDHLYQHINEIGHADVFLIGVKEYDLEAICQQLKSKVTEDTILLPLMNGVDIYERIRKIIPNGIILPSCVYVASHIKEKGIVEHKGIPGKIITGNDPLHTEYSAVELINILKDAGIDITYKTNALSDIWTKFFFIAAFGLVTARYNQSIGQVNENALLQERARLIMREIETISKAKGIIISDTIIEDTFKKAASFPYQTPTSLQLDIQSGKKNTELELFAGAIIDYGRQLAIPVTETEKIYNEIKKGFISV